MTTGRSNGGAPAAHTERDRRRERVGQLARLLDSQFRVPGTGWRFGIEPLIGLVPGLGDIAGLALSTGVVVQSVRLGARGWTVARMVLYVALDATIGSIPVVGSIFDFFFKANTRALALLQEHADDPERTREESAVAVRRTIIAVVVAVVVIASLLVAAAGALLLTILSAVL